MGEGLDGDEIDRGLMGAKGVGGLGQSCPMLLLSWQLAVSINFLLFTKIHKAAVLAHRF